MPAAAVATLGTKASDAVYEGVTSAYGELAADSLSAPPGAGGGGASGMQSMQSFANLSGMGNADGNLWGTNLSGSYTSLGVNSCGKCKF